MNVEFIIIIKNNTKLSTINIYGFGFYLANTKIYQICILMTYFIKCLFHIDIDNNSNTIMISGFNCIFIKFLKLEFSGSTG